MRYVAGRSYTAKHRKAPDLYGVHDDFSSVVGSENRERRAKRWPCTAAADGRVGAGGRAAACLQQNILSFHEALPKGDQAFARRSRRLQGAKDV